MGGKADNGLPLFRVLRGCDRLTHCGGRWKDCDANGNFIRSVIEVRHVPKYPNTYNRYIFEVLCPPENYGKEEKWRELSWQWIDGQYIDTLGPFPREGEYELVKVVETPKHHLFVPLTEAICDGCIKLTLANLALPVKVKLAIIQERRAKEEAAKEQRLIDRIEDMGIADFARHPHIIHPGFKDNEKVSPGGIILPS